MNYQYYNKHYDDNLIELICHKTIHNKIYYVLALTKSMSEGFDVKFIEKIILEDLNES